MLSIRAKFRQLFQFVFRSGRAHQTSRGSGPFAFCATSRFILGALKSLFLG